MQELLDAIGVGVAKINEGVHYVPKGVQPDSSAWNGPIVYATRDMICASEFELLFHEVCHYLTCTVQERKKRNYDLRALSYKEIKGMSLQEQDRYFRLDQIMIDQSEMIKERGFRLNVKSAKMCHVREAQAHFLEYQARLAASPEMSDDEVWQCQNTNYGPNHCMRLDGLWGRDLDKFPDWLKTPTLKVMQGPLWLLLVASAKLYFADGETVEVKYDFCDSVAGW